MARSKKTAEAAEKTLEAKAEEATEKTEEAAEATADAVTEAAEETVEATSSTETDPEAADMQDEDIAYEGEEDAESADSLTFSNGVIEKIVAVAVRDVPGVLGMKGGFVNRIQETFGATVATKGVSVEVGEDNAMHVNISVIIEYGAYAPQVFEDVKKVVVEQVSGMTGLEIGGVNLRIEDVMTADEYKRLQREEEAEEE